MTITARARGALVGQLGQFAAGLHALEVTDDFPAPEPDPLGELRGLLGTFGPVSPTFELALQALEAEPPPPRGPVLVHGDLRLGNLIVGPDGLRAVIDWELIHTGSPAEDLGWLCVKAWRFGSGCPPRAWASARNCWPRTGPRAAPTSAWTSCAGGRSSARCAGA